VSTGSAVSGASLSQRAAAWAARHKLVRKLTLALAAAALLSGIATYASMTGAPPFGPNPGTTLLLLNVNLVLLLVLGAVVARRIVQVWVERRRGLAGSRLHVRLVFLFSAVAVAPTIIVAVFSYLFFSFGVQGWFSDRVRTAIEESLAVAESYLREHQSVIRADVAAMAADLNRDAAYLSFNQPRLQQVVNAQAQLRSLSEAMVVDRVGRPVARAGFTFSLEFERIPEWALQRAREGGVALLTGDTDDRVRALIRLDQFADMYLYVGRFVDPRVLAHMERTQRAVTQYQKLEGERSGFQITFALIFLVVAMLFLVAAVWVGITFATQMAQPITELVVAAERVRGGDLAARVPEGETDGELETLSRAFNRMTRRIEAQQGELVDANRLSDDRRRFTEAVLAGVSAGVVGLDSERRIHLPNRSASELLGIELAEAIGRDFAEVVPEMKELLEEAVRRPDRVREAQVRIERGGKALTLLARVAAEREAGATTGYVLTFDDVTELISAQRKAAWADVARRIAHEIKNPLTPIQLSAERLKRRYLKEIRNDPETFVTCTDTIVRHVGDIGRMVDEFSSFARMPAPVMKVEDVKNIARQAVFLQKTAHSAISFDVSLPEGPLLLVCDGRQVSQALTNLLKNAVESIEGRDSDKLAGEIRLAVEDRAGALVVAVEDNGKGFPRELRDRLTEPYVTTRAKGTGLGLAIVKKIMEDHGGGLALVDRAEGGARAELVFPAERRAEPAEPERATA
jgi:two-component system nitrogen regulation sensor histidine kinase NtrY